MPEKHELLPEETPRLTPEGVLALAGLMAEIGWNMLWVKGFPMPRGKRNVITGDVEPPVEKGF